MKEIGPRRSLGLDSFNRDLIRVGLAGRITVVFNRDLISVGLTGPMSVVIANPDVVVSVGGGLNVS